MNYLTKPKALSPSEFKAQLIYLNTLILSIPDTNDDSTFDEPTMKFLYLHSMSKNWRGNDSRKLEIRLLTTETFDSMTQYFSLLQR